MTRMTTALVLAGALLFLGGCRSHTTATPTLAPTSAPVGASSQTIQIGGLSRTFHIYRPHDLPERPPLVVMLHGGFGDGAEAERDYGWDAEADREHFTVVYPDGEKRAWNTGGGCCGEPARQNVDDVAFITAVVKAVEGEVPIDPARVYATGISNGGMMAYRLACDSDLFAAIGPDAATLLGDCPAPKPVSVLHIHGTADTRIRYNGGKGDGAARIDGPAVPAVNAQWRSTDSCSPPTMAISEAVTTSTAQCPQGRAVELITIAGAGHQWPGSLMRTRKLADPPSTALNATDTFWQSFAAHPKPGAQRGH